MAFWVPWFNTLEQRKEGKYTQCKQRTKLRGDAQDVEFPGMRLEVCSDELLTLRLLTEVVRSKENATLVIRLLEDVVRYMLRVLLFLGLVCDRHVCTFERCRIQAH